MAEAEYDECLLKGGVLTAPPPDFELLETLAWAPDGGYARLNGHLRRLAQSASYFDIAYHEAGVHAALDRAVAGASSPQRVRLLVSENGAARTESTPLVPAVDPARVRLAQTPIDSADRFLFHKTTRRAVYDSRLEPDVDDVLLWNERGELTESDDRQHRRRARRRAGDAAGRGGPARRIVPRRSFWTPARSSSATVSVDDLARATGLWLVNSVRGWRRAVVVERAG